MKSAPTALRQLEGPAAASLAGLVGVFEDLQVALRCCEQLVAALAQASDERSSEGDPGSNGAEAADEGGGEADDGADPVRVEALWTLALLSYARCFVPGEDGVALTEEDLSEAQPEGDVLAWHELLLRLREHHADPAENPRERFTIGVARDDEGAASGVAVTSARQPAVDDLTVRQTGAVAYALSALVDARIQSAQTALLADLAATPPADLERLDPLEVSDPAGPA